MTNLKTKYCDRGCLNRIALYLQDGNFIYLFDKKKCYLRKTRLPLVMQECFLLSFHKCSHTF